MELDPATVAVLLTAAGAPIASAAVWAVIDFLRAIPGVDGLITGRERLWAFGLSVAIVIGAIAVGLSEVPPRYEVNPLFVLGALLAIFNIARLAMAVHDDVRRYPNSLTGTKVPPPNVGGN